MLLQSKVLKTLVDKAKIFTDVRSCDPTIGSVAFKALENDKLAITSTDLECGFYSEIQGRGDSIGSGFTIPKKVLENLLKAKVETLEVETLEDNWISVNNAKIFSLPISEFPAFPDLSEFTDEIIMDRQVLLDYLEKTVFSVAHNEPRHTLNGLYFQMKPDSLTLTSSDGARLSHYKIDAEFELSQDYDLVIPKETIVKLIKVLKKHKKEELLTIRVKRIVEQKKRKKYNSEEMETYEIISHKLGFYVGSDTIVSRCISREFPNFDGILDCDNGFRQIMVNKKELIEKIERVKPFCGEKIPYGKLTFTEGKLTIHGNNPNMGEAKEVMDIASDIPEDEEINFGMNLTYLSQALYNYEPDEVDIKALDHENPFIMFQDRGLTLVMPMRLQ